MKSPEGCSHGQGADWLNIFWQWQISFDGVTEKSESCPSFWDSGSCPSIHRFWYAVSSCRPAVQCTRDQFRNLLGHSCFIMGICVILFADYKFDPDCLFNVLSSVISWHFFVKLHLSAVFPFLISLVHQLELGLKFMTLKKCKTSDSLKTDKNKLGEAN